MDITKSSDKIKTYKFLNGETVNYSVGFFAVSFLFLVLKQLFKIAVGFSAGLSVGLASAVCAVVLFFFERRYVFNGVMRGTLTKQVLLYIFRCAVDFGFYKICSFVFVTVLDSADAFAFLMSFFIYLFFNYYFDRLIVFDCVKKAENNKGGRCFKLFWENRFVLLSTLAAGVFLMLLYMVYQVFPFGDTTVLRMDLYHQYGPLFCELYDKVVNHESFLYSWISGGGSSFLGNYFNYLSSPLSFIVLLFDRKQMPFAITVIVLVKCMLSACTFSLYIKESLKRHSLLSACFGVFYATSGYFLAYYWNVMWLDGMILLPLVVLGIERIIDKGRPICYIASLTVLFYASYYMAYMVCIFSVVYFVAYYFLKHDLFDKVDKNKVFEKRYALGKMTNNRLIRAGLFFAGGSLLAALLCAVSLVPVYLILQNSSATSDSFPSSFEMYYDLLNIATSHLASLETTIRSSGDDILPNIYCGILSVVLLPLFISNRKISVREKAIYILLLLFFIFSFNNNMANFVWHAFHFPNDLPFRFSYMYSFIFLIVAFRTLMRFKGIEYRDVAFSGMLCIFAVVVMQKYSTVKMSEKTVYINLALVAIWTAFLLILNKGKQKRPVISLALVFLVFVEFLVGDFLSIPFSQDYSAYTVNYNTYREAIDDTYGKDKGLYRLELSKLNTRMDSCLYGYRGISTFSSMAYETYSGNQYSLGMYGNRINSYTYNTQTPVYNMFYGIKYIMNTEDSLTPSADYYKKGYVTENKKCEVYENKYFLPFAFTVSDSVKDVEFEEGNPFELQEELIDKACGANDIFIPAKYVDTDYEDVDCETVTENGTYYFTRDDADSASGKIDITIETVNDSNLYVYITSPKLENVNYYFGEKEEYQNIDTPFIKDLGKHKKGEKVKVSIDCASMEEESSYFEIYAYNIDYDKFISAYDLLKLGALDVKSFGDTHISGTVDAGYNGYLYTSIPFDKGWSVYIDGKKQTSFALGDAQLCCEITKGKHEITLKYMPNGFLYGAAASAVTWAGVGVYFLLKRRKKKAKEEFVETV
ncbi:MAG: YfhO family protein [Eubacterium sp.]|nr:YfhO family protein [Eubacterium sp.]